MYNKLLFIDRDKELELQQTCLTEKDRLLQQLQQVTKQSEGTIRINTHNSDICKYDTKTMSSILTKLYYVFL